MRMPVFALITQEMELVCIEHMLKDHLIRIEYFFFFLDCLGSVFILTDMVIFLRNSNIEKNDS